MRAPTMHLENDDWLLRNEAMDWLAAAREKLVRDITNGVIGLAGLPDAQRRFGDIVEAQRRLQVGASVEAMARRYPGLFRIFDRGAAAGAASAEKFSQRLARDGNNNTVNDTSEQLRRASDSQIDAAITAVYDKAEKTGAKPPNIRELREPVQKELRETGRAASGHQIMRLADDEKHRKRRRKGGKTLASEKRKAAFTK